MEALWIAESLLKSIITMKWFCPAECGQLQTNRINLQGIKQPIKLYGIKLQDIRLHNIKPRGIKSQGIMPRGAKLLSISDRSIDLFLPSKMANPRLTNPSP
jgi:hypothetical protein